MPEETIEATERPAKKNGGAVAEAAPKKRTLAKLMSRATTGPGGGEATLRRRKMRVVVDYRICDPGAFSEDFSLTLESPSTDVELAAIKKYATENPGAVPMEMCRMCLIELDGERLSDGDLSRAAVWEALGSKGRALVAHMWNQLSGGGHDAEALKKAQATQSLLV